MINQSWAAKMAQQAKVPAAKLGKDPHGREGTLIFTRAHVSVIHAHKVNNMIFKKNLKSKSPIN